jgi:hypothetical protein
VISVSAALRQREGDVRVRATVTAGPSLLDATGRRIVIEDATAAIEVLLPTGTSGPAPGTVVEVSGTLGRAYGAPRIRAKQVDATATNVARAPVALAGPPGTAHEWRLVRIAGTVLDVRRLGSRWRAELQTPGGRVPITGMAGAAIPSSALIEGRPATIVGIVRRANPSATDRRFSILPRGPGDVSVGPGGRSGTGTNADTSTGRTTGGAGATGQQGLRPDPEMSLAPGTVDVDLVELDRWAGKTVRVGGLVVDLAADGFTLDDGTAVASVILDGAAAEYLALIEPEDPLNVIGRVEARDGGAVVVVSDPAGIVRVGDLPAIPAPVATSAATDEATVAPPVAIAGTGPATADAGGPLGLGATGLAGIGSLLLLSIASVAVTLLRRQRLRQALLARVGVRLAGITAPPRTPPEPPGRPS